MVLLFIKKIKLPLVTYFVHEFLTQWPSLILFGASLINISYTSVYAFLSLNEHPNTVPCYTQLNN